MKGAWIEDLAWPAVSAAIGSGRVVVIPIGAAAKEHGFHMPMRTDYLLARGLAECVARYLPVLIAPVVSVGHYPAFVKYPGSQSLSASTFVALLCEIMEGLIAQGATRIAFINTGVSTEAPLQIAVREIFQRHTVRPVVADLRFLGREADRILTGSGGGHADERETSLLLALHPDLVRLSEIPPDPDSKLADSASSVFRSPIVFSPEICEGTTFNPSGATGTPSLASAEKGRILLKAIEEELVTGLKAAFPEAAFA